MPFLQRRKKQRFSKPEINFWLTNSKFRRIIVYGVERHLSQSRNLCVKCFADGELPQERKVYPAVQISHPAVTLGHIIQRAEQSVRFFLPEATTEIQEVKNMSQLKKIQSSLLEMKSIYALAAIAMLLALRIVLGFFANNVKLSAAFLPIAVTGVMFGPIPAAIVGALGDILSFIIAPTGAYFPGFTINGFITGFIYGMFLYKNNVTPLRVVLAWFTNMLCVETFLIAFWLYTLYGGGSTPYTVYLTARFISVAVKCIPEIILVFALGKLAGKIRVPHAIKRT